MTGTPSTVVVRTASCNILMADASVKNFSDLNNDKFLNPGFPVPDNLSDAVYATTGYRGSEIELDPGRIFSGVFPDEPAKAQRV